MAKELLKRGERVRALVRKAGPAGELAVETVQGDLRNAESLNRAVRGCSAVYHVAADYRLWAADPSELYRSNVDGTRSLLEAARREGIAKFVYTSTVGCIGVPAGGIGEESMPVSLNDMAGAYKRSKYLAEQVALEFARDGYPVVIVNPTAPVGERDIKPTPTGKIVLDFLKGDMPAYIDTGLNLVDVRDAAVGHVLAAERGKPGERYILGCSNLTLREILERLARLSGLKAPNFRIPYFVAYGVGLCSTAWASLSGREPRAPIDAVRMARKKMFVSCDKARRELGFEPAPVEGALERAIEWFRSNRYV